MWLMFTPSFCNAVMQDGLEQMSWFLACGFIKDDIRICCEKLWSNMKFMCVSAVFIFFTFLVGCVVRKFQKFSDFIEALNWTAFWDKSSIKKHKEMWTFVANKQKKFLSFLWTFSKGIAVTCDYIFNTNFTDFDYFSNFF